MKKFTIHPVSLIVWLWLLIVLGPLLAFSYILAIFIHEAGHFWVAKRLGYQLSKFSLSPYGVSLSYYQQELNHSDEIKIALAGPLINLFSVIVLLGFWWIYPEIYAFTEDFVFVSIMLALFNLLPAYPMDGGRIFTAMASNFMSTKTARKITITINLLLSGVFLCLFIAFLFINFNPTYLLFVVFLIFGVLDLKFVTKFEKINIFRKKTKNFAKPTIYQVNGEVKLANLLKKIQTGKTCLFVFQLPSGRVINLSEKMVVNLLVSYDYNATLGEIFQDNKKVRK